MMSSSIYSFFFFVISDLFHIIIIIYYYFFFFLQSKSIKFNIYSIMIFKEFIKMKYFSYPFSLFFVFPFVLST